MGLLKTQFNQFGENFLAIATFAVCTEKTVYAINCIRRFSLTKYTESDT